MVVLGLVVSASAVDSCLLYVALDAKLYSLVTFQVL